MAENKEGLDMATTRFHFQGERLSEYDTASSIELKELDIIEVVPEDIINLKVIGSKNKITLFILKKHTPLKKLMGAYCKSKGLDMATTRFLFQGERLSEYDTPSSIELKELDIIEVVPHNVIYLKVIDEENVITLCKIKKHTPLKKLMEKYSKKKGLDMATRFLFDGEILSENDTPSSIPLEELDIIEVYLAQIGG